MRDRVPLYPGRVRMTPVAGQANTYDMVRADEAKEAGTPLNKATLLQDSTAKAIGLTQANPTVDDALNGLSNKVNQSYKIGNMLSTSRTDLGSKWLLCNGDPISLKDYPELTVLLRAFFGNQYFETKDVWADSAVINCITYANGYWVAGGTRTSGISSSAILAYTTSLNSTWTVKTLWSGVMDGAHSINCIAYENGYWVVGGQAGGANGRIAYAATPTGSWTTKDLWASGSGSDSSVNCITHADGYWVVGGKYNDRNAQIAYTTNLSGDWTTKNVWTSEIGGSAGINCICYANGHWVAGGQSYASYKYYASLSYATGLTGSWITKNMWSGSTYNNFTTAINCITYSNGFWAAGGLRYDSDTKSYYGTYAYAKNPSENWIINNLWTSIGENNPSGINSINFIDGNWIMGGQFFRTYGRIANASSLSGTWKMKDLWHSSNTDFSSVNCITYVNEHLVAGGQFENNYARIAYPSDDNALLPAISSGESYTYIKAVE